MLQQGIIVLDSGCGPGTWTLEMAEAFPQSKFYGIDITSVFPDSIMPSNVEFAAGNIAKTLPYPDNSFNYIHQRLLVVALTNEDWNNVSMLLKQVYSCSGF
jgi:ubiquinone/menaquinone biosynthesis C-methylase UbiE